MPLFSMVTCLVPKKPFVNTVSFNSAAVIIHRHIWFKSINSANENNAHTFAMKHEKFLFMKYICERLTT